MSYFAIREEGGDEDICVCCEETLEEVNAKLVLGPGNYLIREIDEDEANQFAQEWANGDCCEEDICPICESPRCSDIRGEIVIKVCKSCGLES